MHKYSTLQVLQCQETANIPNSCLHCALELNKGASTQRQDLWTTLCHPCLSSQTKNHTPTPEIPMCSTGKFNPKLACTKLHCPAPGLPAGPAEELRLPAGEGAQGPCPALCQELALGNTAAFGEPQNTPRALTPPLTRAPSAQVHPQERRGSSKISIQLQQRPW